MNPFDQPVAQTAFPAEASLETQHATVVVLVIVSEEVEEAVQSKNPELGAFRVARRAGLAPGNASRDDDVS
jgi:hypothetical protein